MPLTIDELVAKYLITDADRPDHPAYPPVTTYEDSWVTPLIDGYEYFQRLSDAINDLDGEERHQGIYIAGWHLDSAFEFRWDIGMAAGRLDELLVEKAARGADVRVLIWVSDFVLATGVGLIKTPLQVALPVPGIRQATKVPILMQNLKSIRSLRSLRPSDGGAPPLRDSVLANTLDHQWGAAHMKFALVFDREKASAFTGGMDIVENRFSTAIHGVNHPVADEDNSWHDVMVEVQGSATQACYDYYREQWNELARRVTRPEASPEFRIDDEVILGTPVGSTLLPSRLMPPSAEGAGSLLRLQSLRTVPPQPVMFGDQPGPLFSNGAFEVQLALKKAIGNAEEFIYVEDQAMEGREVFGYLKRAIQTKPNLRLILLTGLKDPADPETKTRNLVIRTYLTDGLADTELSRIAFYEHQAAVIHSKLWLIDDVFALVGSANIGNRGMFTEIEHAVSFVHLGEVNLCRELRIRLWGEHFRLPPSDRLAELQDHEVALNIWNPGWVPRSTNQRPTFRLPTHTEDFQRFLRPWTRLVEGRPDTDLPFPYSVLNQTPALVPMRTPWPNDAGSQEVVQAGGRDFAVVRTFAGGRLLCAVRDPEGDQIPQERPPGTITAVGPDFIDDQSLPDNDFAAGAAGLAGMWVRVWLGRDESHLRRISSHNGHRVFFSPIRASPPRDTLEYALLAPLLKPVPLPPQVSPLQLLTPFDTAVLDVGEPPT